MIHVELLTAKEIFPCTTNELYDEEGDMVLVLYVAELVDLPVGLWLSTEGYYEAVINKDEIDLNDVKPYLEEIEQLTGIRFELKV
jgi:hypothetical protein